jgi:hypothetical protein
MRCRPACTTELPFGRVHPVGGYADNVTSEHHVDSSDQLAIHLHLSYIPNCPTPLQLASLQRTLTSLTALSYCLTATKDTPCRSLS